MSVGMRSICGPRSRRIVAIPVLARVAPSTSKDADIFVKDRDLAVAIATAAGWQFRSNPEPRSPVLGAMVLAQEDKG